jgi:ribosomal protein S27AE
LFLSNTVGEKQIKFCPRCGSTDIGYLGGIATLLIQECKNCGYRGIFAEGSLELVEKIKVSYLNKKIGEGLSWLYKEDSEFHRYRLDDNKSENA